MMIIATQNTQIRNTQNTQIRIKEIEKMKHNLSHVMITHRGMLGRIYSCLVLARDVTGALLGVCFDDSSMSAA